MPDRTTCEEFDGNEAVAVLPSRMMEYSLDGSGKGRARCVKLFCPEHSTLTAFGQSARTARPRFAGGDQGS